jgi:hypothetical protein
MDGLLALLSSDAVMHTDGGGKASALPLPIYGPDKVTRASVFGLTKLKTLNPLQRIVEINGEPGIVSYVEGRPTVGLHYRGERWSNPGHLHRDQSREAVPPASAAFLRLALRLV